jgi:glycerol-3-phosphate dehydrogenase (NAD(P)+)
MAEITVLGAGMMGSALCVPLADAGHSVRLVGTHLDDDIVRSLKQASHHPKLDWPLPRAIRPFSLAELGTAMVDTELIVLGVSSAGVRWAARQIADFVRPGLPIVMISKGLEWTGESLRTLPDVLCDELPASVRAHAFPVAVAGPCIAGELARRVETCVVFTGRNPELTRRCASFFRVPYYHIWASDDVVGVEACAALKNAYAMGIALAIGLHEQRKGGPISETAPAPGSIALHNYEAAVFAQAVYEMQQIVALAGGSPASVPGLPGVGDLDVTCNGGRTGRFGRLLGLGLGVEESVGRMHGATLECLDILRVTRSALADFEGRGLLGARALPLLRHMAAVALDDAAVDMPFEDFFGGRLEQLG